MTRRFLFFFMLSLASLLFPTSMFAGEEGNGFYVKLKDGAETFFEFAQKPVVTFSSGTLFVKTSADEIAGAVDCSFVLDNVLSIKLVSQTSTNIGASAVSPKFYFDGQTVTVTGADVRDASVYSLNGVRQPVSLSSTPGGVSFSVTGLPSGIYIVKAAARTFKIIKR